LSQKNFLVFSCGKEFQCTTPAEYVSNIVDVFVCNCSLLSVSSSCVRLGLYCYFMLCSKLSPSTVDYCGWLQGVIAGAVWKHQHPERIAVVMCLICRRLKGHRLKAP